MRPLEELLGHQTARSALVLRRILGPVRLRPVRPEVGRPYYQAETALEVLDLLESGRRRPEPRRAVRIRTNSGGGGN